MDEWLLDKAMDTGKHRQVLDPCNEHSEISISCAGCGRQSIGNILLGIISGIGQDTWKDTACDAVRKCKQNSMDISRDKGRAEKNEPYGLKQITPGLKKNRCSGQDPKDAEKPILKRLGKLYNWP